jgi:O-antigen/teichoic acid export membrane protein
MSLRRILKLLAAFSMSQGVTIVSQLLVPPLFLHRYAHGVEMYGEWIALTAAISYLGTLNAGIQNYANNQMTLHYNRGEFQEARTVQSTALRLILIMVLVATGAGVGILFMPLARWLSLRNVNSAAASTTLFLMMLQLVGAWFFAFLTNSYQVIGELHRGANWQNMQRLAAVLAMAAFLWRRASFPVLALTQLTSMIAFAVMVLIEIRVRAPVLLPSLRYGTRHDMLSVLKPSAYYGLFAFCSFLAFQGPVLLIQKLLGPVSVAIFALSRTIFSMSRQLLMILSYSIGQETINLIALRSWAQLRRIYDLSERVVLLFVSTLTVGTLLISPVLFAVWLHERALYDPGMCMLMAAVSAVMGIKEHKYVFQYLSNRHEGVARFSFVVYLGMMVVTALTLKEWGLDAFMILWLVAEGLITAYIVIQNRKLFPAEFRPSLAPLPRVAILLTVAFAAAAWPIRHDTGWPLVEVGIVAILGSSALAIIGFFAFGLREVQGVILNRLRRRIFAVDSSV